MITNCNTPCTKTHMLKSKNMMCPYCEIDRLRAKLESCRSGSENYLGWARWKRGIDETALELCDSDDEGAFKIYRHPDRELDRLRAELEQVIGFNELIDRLAKDIPILPNPNYSQDVAFLAYSIDSWRKEAIKRGVELATERRAWDIYDALYPGCYHNANYFRNKAREGR